MAKNNSLGTFILQVHPPRAVGFTAISVDAYAAFFRSISESVASKMSFQNPKELTLATDVKPLVKALTSILSRKRKLKCHTLLFEMLDEQADVHVYDDLCLGLDFALRQSNMTQPWCIGFAVSNHDTFQESVLLKERLLPWCADHGVGLLLLSDNQGVKPSILCQGKLPKLHKLPALRISEHEPDKKKKTEERLSSEQVAAEFQVLFGHFETNLNGRSFHVPAVASVRKLSKNKTFLQQMRNDVSRMLDSETFTVVPFGMLGGGIDTLALALVEGDTERFCDPTVVQQHDGSPLLFLCDFLSSMYPIEDRIRLAITKRTKQMAVVGIARFQDSLDLKEIPVHFYLDTDYQAVSAGGSSCRFCKQEVPVTRGEHFDKFAREIKQYDPFTFWEFIAQSKDFFQVGHWPSNRTPNHYLFRILAKPIFKRYGHDLSLRLRNILESTNIPPVWVKKIVCTEGEESALLSAELSEVLGLRQEDVVKIPRKFFKSMAGKKMDPDLLQYINDNYGEESIRRKNVLIVDQAAHHFKTLSALRDVCEYFDCTVLAFAVFIDRTDTELSLGEYLHDSHYISLYSWSVPPRRAHECPCVEVL